MQIEAETKTGTTKHHTNTNRTKKVQHATEHATQIKQIIIQHTPQKTTTSTSVILETIQ